MNQLPPLGGPKDKFTPELRILVASLLSMGVILLWAKFFGPKPPVNLPQANQPAQVSTATPGKTAPAIAPGTPAVPANISAVSTPTVLPTADTQERTIVVENALYRVEFSNRGAVVKSWQLKNYKDDSKPQKTLDLVHQQAAEQTGGWPFSVVLDDPQSEKAANAGLYKVSSDANALEAPTELTFSWSDGHLEITKHFRFDHSYVVEVEMTATLNGLPIHGGLAWRGGFGDLTVTNPIPVETVFTYYGENGKLVTFPHKKLEGPEKWGTTWAGGKTYVGIEDRYFTAAFLPPADSLSTRLETRYWKVTHTVVVESKEQQGKEHRENVPEGAPPTEEHPMRTRVFVGPKDYDDLKAMRPPLHDLVQFGWLEFIADPLFHGLQWLYKHIPTWGL